VGQTNLVGCGFCSRFRDNRTGSIGENHQLRGTYLVTSATNRSSPQSGTRASPRIVTWRREDAHGRRDAMSTHLGRWCSHSASSVGGRIAPRILLLNTEHYSQTPHALSDISQSLVQHGLRRRGHAVVAVLILVHGSLRFILATFGFDALSVPWAICACRAPT